MDLSEQLVPAFLLEEQIKQNKELLKRVTHLQHQLDVLLRSLYGTKSEKKPVPPDNKDVDVTSRDDTNDSSNKAKPKRKPLPKDLPREKIRYELSDDKLVCSNCSTKQHIIGKLVTEQLELVPAKLFVKEHIRYKYACKYGCQVSIADMPEQPIPKGIPGPGLLSDVLINKYQDSLPLYRQSLRFKRYGIDIPGSTLCDWVGKCAALLEPIVSKIKDDLLSHSKIHTDDTTIPVLSKGKTKTARLWTYVADGSCGHKATVYDFSMSRSALYPQKFLNGFQGYLQADAYPGYDKLYADGKIIEVGCLAHVRRKFYDISIATKTEYDNLADIAVKLIGDIYKHEKTARALTHQQRYYYRKQHTKKCYHKLHWWLARQQLLVIPKTPIYQAITYALNHWRALTNVFADGRLEVDNNTAERAIKPLVIGRKNYMFAGSPEGGKRAAIIYSIIETCKQNEVNSLEYLTDVIARVGTHKINQIQQLTPYQWKPL